MQNGRKNKIKKADAPKIFVGDKCRENRIFILDTNVLLHDSQSIFSFHGVVVGIPFVVLEELDTFKKDPGENGRNAREVIRTLDELRNKGCLSRGVEIQHNTQGAILKVLTTPSLKEIPQAYGNIIDNLIIKTVQNLVNEGYEATFVTKDINSRIKADALGLSAEDYTKGRVISEDYYKGWIKLPIPANDLRKITVSKLPELLLQQNQPPLFPNEFIILESENNPENYKLFRFFGGQNFKEVQNTRIIAHFGARNVQQLMCLDLLRDDSVKIVSLVGSAGTGKTFLTLLMGLQKVAREHLYKKFLISRPVVALGADIGYLPGEVQEKLRYWMQPVYDNLEFIFSQVDEYHEEILGYSEDKRERKFHKRFSREKFRYTDSKISEVDILQEKGILSLEAITYMRGRSIPYQFVLIDEVQNLNPHEVKTIISRAGEGTKIIIAGDPFQIDSPYLDFSSNGLTVSTEKFKGQSIFGTVFLEKSERSELAKLAAKIL